MQHAIIFNYFEPGTQASDMTKICYKSTKYLW